MKNKFSIVIASAALTLFSCSDDYYDSLNVNHTSPSNVPASFLVTNATTSLFTQMTSTSVNFNIFKLFAQYYTETQYVDEANFDMVKRNIAGNHWSELYRNVLFDLKDARTKIESDATLRQSVKDNQLAIIDIMEVYTWQVLVDTFGNVPYTQALQGLNNPNPVYDDAATIYSDLIVRITSDINKINTSDEGFGDKDLIYFGDMSNWKKLAASLKLRIGVQLLDANPTLGTSTIKDAVTAGVFDSNNDNFVLEFMSTAPYQNPIGAGLNSDFVPADTLIDYMNGLNDPRRFKFFAENMGSGVFVGSPYGEGSAFASTTHFSSTLYSYTNPGDLLDYSEVEFLLAEASAKGVNVGGTIESHYNEGIKASMEYWDVSTVDINNYLLQNDVNFNTASGTALQKIAKQFWLAMFNRGFEGWNVWRRLDYPNLKSPAPLSGLPIPNRYIYPIGERTINGTNYSAAATAIGGDRLTTKLFWDKN